MPNRKLAEEWILHASKNLETAVYLNNANHYTDVISIDIQQAVEKALKAVYAFHGIKIPRTHELEILFNFVSEYIQLVDTDIRELLIISDYYQTERYPGPRYFLPDRNEINQSIAFASKILSQVQKYVNSTSDS